MSSQTSTIICDSFADEEVRPVHWTLWFVREPDDPAIVAWNYAGGPIHSRQARILLLEGALPLDHLHLDGCVGECLAHILFHSEECVFSFQR